MVTDQLCNDAFICDPFLKNEVVVMENDPNTQSRIKDIITDELAWHVKTVANKTEAVKLVENKEAAFYILDVGMGKNREQEGLDALEQIKSLDQKVFVSVYSGKPGNKKQAENLEANLFQEKSSKIREDVNNITDAMLDYQLKIIDNIKQNILEKKRLKFTEDTNITAYEKLKSTGEWFEQYKNKYVAFVDGNLVDSDPNRQNLLERLKDSKYGAKPIFFTKVEENIRVIDMPSPLWLDVI